MKDISVSKVRLLDLLSDDNLLVVPKYQRNFAWDNQNLAELWEDLFSVVFKERKEHFMGALILCEYEDKNYFKTENVSTGISGYEIIDGQQRLSAFTIILRVLYDLTKESNPKLAGDIYDSIRGGRYENKAYFKLVLGEDDKDFFRDYIQEENGNRKKGKKKSHKLIRFAYEFFSEKISEELRKSGSENFIEVFWGQIKQKVVCARIHVESDVEAYLIFESINSKRADLTLADLLKNLIYMTAKKLSDYEGSDHLSTVQDNWQEMLDNLTEAKSDFETPQYIRHFYVWRWKERKLP